MALGWSGLSEHKYSRTLALLPHYVLLGFSGRKWRGGNLGAACSIDGVRHECPSDRVSGGAIKCSEYATTEVFPYLRRM